MKFELPSLPYDYNALEPHIDEQTMRVHHDKHHQAYVNKLNEALEKHPEFLKNWPASSAGEDLEKLLQNLEDVPEDIRTAVRNNGGGHFNHSYFWKIMAPKKGVEVKGDLAEAIRKDFGSFQKFKEQFTQIANSFFGSGWIWLFEDEEGILKIEGFPGHDSPVMMCLKPLLVIDVWEHAYYLKYQNRRPEYVEAWWNTVNWDEVEKNFQK